MKRNIKILMFAFASVLALSACSSGGQSSAPAASMPEASMEASGEAGAEGETKKAEYHKLTPEQAKERIDANKELIIVDVREPDEYAGKHIPDAVLIPLGTIGDSQPEQLPDLDAEILVYCRSGVRSKQASEKLVALGYTGIYDIGGIKDWPYDTVAGS